MRSLAALLLLPAFATAQIVRQPDATLHSAYPSGATCGSTVIVELGALEGLEKATGVIVDGPPGVTVKDYKAVNTAKATVSLSIAADAEPGPRFLRVVGGTHGLTSARPFFVSNMPEVLEKEPNDSAPQPVAIPAVVNGRIDPATDTDAFSFKAKAGQKIVAAVLAHRMDARFRTRTAPGYLDTSLELTDSTGKIVATAEDTFGLDPALEYVVPAEGEYAVRVKSLGFEGAPSAVYRLTLGDVPYPAAAFPAGGQRGKATDVQLLGLNLPSTTIRHATPDSAFPWSTVPFKLTHHDGRDLPFLIGEHPEHMEAEPNDSREKATAVPVDGFTVNGRFDSPSDAEWYKVTLKKGQGVLVEVAAQRHIRSPVDTHLLVTDAKGTMLAENDDGDLFSGQCEHDFPSADSRLEFTAPADGDFFIRLTDQNGTAGPLALYRLTIAPLVPDFRLNQWPDVVPIWGPGSTASFVVQVQRWGGLKGDIQLRIEGLPPGWRGSVGIAQQDTYYAPRHGLNQKALMTITAPANAKVGDLAAFRVIGRVQNDGKAIEREAWPQTLLGSSHTDRMHLRYSPVARAAVAPPLDSRIEAGVKELTVKSGEKATIPVKVFRTPVMTNPISVSIDGEAIGASSAWRTPLTLKADENDVQLSLEIAADRRPGTYGIVVSRGWAADLRAGRPGPCSELILLTVKPK
ncbi:MAG: PPC domain-containing protein [Gemmataceae bacterium]